MILYPSSHKILSTENVNLNIDIPLAYINTNSTDYITNIVPLLNISQKQQVIPYSCFNTLNMCFFDDNDNMLLGSNYLSRENFIYKFKPELMAGTSSFIPLDYSYYIIGKRDSIYKSYEYYNLNIACVDSLPNLQLSNKLIPLFGDAPDRGISPNNITVNNKNKSIQNLTNSSIQNSDFIFIESSNGQQYKKYWSASSVDESVQYSKDETVYYNGLRYKCLVAHISADTWASDQNDPNDSSILYWSQVDNFYISPADNNIDINTYLSYSTNLWIITDDYTECNKCVGDITTSVSSPVAIKNDNLSFNSYFNVNSLRSDDNIVIHNIFNSTDIPIIIYEYINKGFVIVSTKEFFDNIVKYTDLFYEVLMTVYLKSYIRSKIFTDWIADKMPNYIVSNRNLIQKDKFTSKSEVYKIFGLDKTEFKLIDVVIDSSCPYVIFSGFLNDYIYFTKLYTGDYAKYADNCNYDGTTIFVDDKIVLLKNFIYIIEDNISDKLSYVINNNKIYITVSQFKSSSNNICSEKKLLSYDLIYNDSMIKAIDLYLCYNSEMLLVPVNNYTPDYGTKIAEIQITKIEDKNTILDMRQLGGGLPESCEDNYDLLDIGNINGRPYRKANTLVITLPLRLKPYKDLILDAVKKHMVAEDFPIILFE